MKDIHLVDTRGFEVGAGVIIAMSTGVTFSNQVGGMSCDHPKLEGVFFPLVNVDLKHYDKLCAWQGKIPDWIAEEIDEAFERERLPLAVDTERQGTECWIPVIVKDNDHELWRQFVGHVGIYTTADNCD